MNDIDIRRVKIRGLVYVEYESFSQRYGLIDHNTWRFILDCCKKTAKMQDCEFQELLESELKNWRLCTSSEAKYRREMLEELIEKLNE